MAVTINGDTGVTTPGISNSEGYTGDGLTIAAGAPSGAVAVNSSGNVGIGTSSPTYRLHSKTTDSSSISGIFETSVSGGAYVSFKDTGTSQPYNVRVGSIGENLVFQTSSAERARIDSSGNLLVGTTNSGGAGGFSLLPNNSAGAPSLITNRSATTAVSTVLQFRDGGTPIGSISHSNTSTAFNTSSDYRLKENIQPMTGALAKVAALKPCTYQWKADGSDGEGFIAHELQEVVPDCVTGEKDAVDAEGKPVYQGIDTSFLVATLTAAIQELKAQVDAQAVEIAALKGQA